MTHVDGGDHHTATGQDLNKMFARQTLQGFTDRRMPNADAFAEHGLRHHAARREFKSHDHLFNEAISFLVE